MKNENYSPLMRLRLDKRVERQPGDRVELYGPGIPVLERDGHIVGILGAGGWEVPMMMCPIRKDGED